MDVFHIDSSSISSTSLIDSEITEVKFETEHFDLNFFDTPDDSLTQVAFSNPNSVESSTSPTPEPAIAQQSSISSSNVTINQQQQTLAIIKNGKKRLRLERQRKIHFLMLIPFIASRCSFSFCRILVFLPFRFALIINYDNNIIREKARHHHGERKKETETEVRERKNNASTEKGINK